MCSAREYSTADIRSARSKGLRVAPAAVANLSKRMQAAAPIGRVGDDADGRVTRVRPSARGQDASRQAHAVPQDVNARLTAVSRRTNGPSSRWLTRAAEPERDLPRD